MLASDLSDNFMGDNSRYLLQTDYRYLFDRFVMHFFEKVKVMHIYILILYKVSLEIVKYLIIEKCKQWCISHGQC